MGSSTTSPAVAAALTVGHLITRLHPQFLTRSMKYLAGEICTDWQPWGEYLKIRFILGQSLLHSFVYVALAVIVLLHIFWCQVLTFKL